ncbi:MAG: SLC13 family permease [Deltaproteobacteria bacterium]|nr:SLC13 family permease [Deltaproteobacteria bacterium]
MAAAAPAPGDTLNLSGVVRDSQGRELRDVQVQVEVDGQPLPTIEGETLVATDRHGVFVAEFALPAGKLPPARVEIRAQRPGFRSAALPVPVIEAPRDRAGGRVFQAVQKITLKRRLTSAAWIAGGVLLAVFALITMERLHRTLAATLGAALLLFITYAVGTFNEDFFILSFEDAVEAIDMNVVFLLLGMMFIVGVLRKTGLFRWLAYQAYALARGRVLFLVCFLMLFTAAVSALIDNVTTMLLVIPVTIELALPLKVNPTAFLIPEVFAANLGGAATLIGDPPNVMIGSYARLSFVDFLANMSGIVLICVVVAVVYYFFWYRRVYRRVFDLDVSRTLDFFKTEYRIRDKRLLARSLIILAGMLLLFLVHHLLGMPPSVAALSGAILLVIISRVDIVSLLEHEVEWPTLLFLMALFIIIAGVRSTGLLQMIADWVDQTAGGNFILALLLVLWISALASCVVETTAFTAAMLPIIAHLSSIMPAAQGGALWWALALGAAFGGNGTMIGASANIVTVGLAEKAGYSISFGEYLKACFIPMLVTLALSTVYLITVY